MGIDIRLLIVVIMLGICIPLLFFYFRKAGGELKKDPKPKSSKRRLEDMHRVAKKSATTPQALRMMANSQYELKLWEEAADSYDRLLKLTKDNPSLFDVMIPTRLGISALNAKQYERAVQALLVARSVKENSFEVNFALGKAYYLKKNHSEAANYLRWALLRHPDHHNTQRLLGLSLARSGRFNESLPLLEKCLAYNPQDATLMFYYARGCHSLGNTQRALEYYKQLENNIQYGPYALLQIGMESSRKKQYEESVELFEKGLSYPKIPQSVFLDLNYNLADAYVAVGKYKQSTEPLRSIIMLDPGFKDSKQKLELYENEKLHIFLLGSYSMFSKLAVRMANALFPNDEVHAIRANETIAGEGKIYDLVVRVHHQGSIDHACIRLVRSRTAVQDNELRELNDYMRDNDASNGVCFCAASYSDLAVDYASSRPIRLFDRSKLLNFFNTMQ